MKDAKNITQNAKAKISNFIEYITKHRFILLFVILGAAIAFALLRTQSYIDIPRNEDRYIEESVKIRYKQIDEETLNSFSEASRDEEIEVDSNFNPDRENPFSE